jgi:hypothetical protein
MFAEMDEMHVLDGLRWRNGWREEDDEADAHWAAFMCELPEAVWHTGGRFEQSLEMLTELTAMWDWFSKCKEEARQELHLRWSVYREEALAVRKGRGY